MRKTLWFRIGAVTLIGAFIISCGGGGANSASTAATGSRSGSASPSATELKWYSGCGSPVCSSYSGPFEGVPLCGAEREGGTCSAAGAQCDPRSECNARLVCADKDPKQQPGGCPISRASFKQDIRYLTDEQKQQIYREIEALRLATYRYRNAGSSGPQRLGFLIDDVARNEQSALAESAVDAERNQVDLYGYTSMAVAALQVQSAQIRQLRREVEQLRKAVADQERRGERDSRKTR